MKNLTKKQKRLAVTYAYFIASNNIDTTNIYPGWVGYQVVTVEGDNGAGIGKYSLTI